MPGQTAPGSTATIGPTRTTGPLLAVGHLRASWPTLGLQRQYAEAADVDPDAIVTSRDLKEVIAQPENRYLARQVCWTFNLQSVAVCQILARHDADIDELIDALAPDDDQAVQVLVADPASPADASGCWMPGLPAVTFVQIYSFGMDQFANALGERYDVDRAALGAGEATRGGAAGGAEGGEGKGDTEAVGGDQRWRTMVRDVFYRLTRRAEMTGFADDDRARNYLALQDAALYALIYNALRDGSSLVDVTTRRIVRAGRRMVAVRLTFRHRQTQVIDRYERLVDTHDVFCFAVGSLTPVYD